MQEAYDDWLEKLFRNYMREYVYFCSSINSRGCAGYFLKTEKLLILSHFVLAQISTLKCGLRSGPSCVRWLVELVVQRGLNVNVPFSPVTWV